MNREVMTSSQHSSNASIDVNRHDLSSDELQIRAAEAYLFYYPLVLMEFTRRKIRANDRLHQPTPPASLMVHNRRLYNAKWRSVARTNIDTLFSSCWLDLGNRTATLSIPSSQVRFYMYQFLDMWTDTFAVVGVRTIGSKGATFRLQQHPVQLAPANLDSGLDSDDEIVMSIPTPTRHSWIIGRTYATSSPQDVVAARQHQDGVTVSYDTETIEEPAIEVDLPVDTPVGHVDRMSPAEFFQLADALHRREGGHATDWSQILRLQPLGLASAQPFDFLSQPEMVRTALTKGFELGADSSSDQLGVSSRQGQWKQFSSGIGIYGNDYRRRAIIARYGLAANPREDAVYLSTNRDNLGRRFSMAETYRIRFEADQLPPAEFFWSITVYDADGQFMDNQWDKYGVRSADGLRYNDDGSLDLLIASSAPTESRVANWIPVTCSNFTLTLRIYGPGREVLSGAWEPPAVCYDSEAR